MESTAFSVGSVRPVAFARTPLSTHARSETKAPGRAKGANPLKNARAFLTLGNKTSRLMRGDTAFPIDERRCGVVASEIVTTCGVKTTPKKDKKGTSAKPRFVKDKHLFFDRVVITVKAGNGGNGEILTEVKSKRVKNFKYNPGGSSPKKITLTRRDPFNGSPGADVIIKVDQGLDSLLHLHERQVYTAPNGGNANTGDRFPTKKHSSAQQLLAAAEAKVEPLVLSVPPGTVVR
eukprot:CAMPEP_0118944216 /NCGR_PEP_ID=MMETSP1169-20130426/39878_1 /TAXON_ID=36882 /ORGANISM="Pyramimonas obovata, Strain CCMP722" /LENGTH=233 /DNA_ID=CAMNT_0006889659 /DNA_START=197 /DNA_END=895 /DNA_ORIENTATION=+